MSALFFAHILLHTHTPAAMYCAWTHFGKCIQCREVADVIHDILISLNLIDDFRMCIYIKIYVCIYSEEQKRNTLMHKRKPHILSFWSSFSDKIIRNGYRGERESQREKSRHCMVCTHTYKLNEKKSPIFTHKYLCVVFSLTFTKGHEITCTTAMATTKQQQHRWCEEKKYELSKYCQIANALKKKKKKKKFKNGMDELATTGSFHILSSPSAVYPSLINCIHTHTQLFRIQQWHFCRCIIHAKKKKDYSQFQIQPFNAHKIHHKFGRWWKKSHQW